MCCPLSRVITEVYKDGSAGTLLISYPQKFKRLPSTYFVAQTIQSILLKLTGVANSTFIVYDSAKSALTPCTLSSKLVLPRLWIDSKNVWTPEIQLTVQVTYV